MTDVAELEIRADSRKVREASRDLAGMSAASSGLTRSLGILRNSLAVLVTAKLIGSLAKATAEFTQELANLSAITGATGEDLAFYAEQAKEIGATTSLSASQAAIAFKLIASAKPELLKSADALAQVTKEAVTLAEATGIDLASAAGALGSALNQFQIDADKANDVINILAASSKLGTAEVASVTEALRNAGSASNALGLDLAETVAGIQALAASGRQGADAGTALRQVLLKLEKTADKDLMPSMVGLSDALDELESRNLNNTELMKLFGEEAFTAATSLLAQKDIVSDLNVELRGTNTATEQAAIRMDTLTGDTLALASSWESLLLTVGETGIWRSVIQALTDTNRGLTELIDGSLTYEVKLRRAIEAQIDFIDALNEGGQNTALADKQLADLIEQLRTFQSEALTAAERAEAFQKALTAGADPFGSDEGAAPWSMFGDQDNAPSGVLRPAAKLPVGIEIETPDREQFDELFFMRQEMDLRLIEMLAERDATELEMLKDKNGKIKTLNEETLDEMSIFAEEASRNIQDALADFLFDPFEDGLEGMVKGFAKTLQRMAAEQAAAGIMDFFTGSSAAKTGKPSGGGFGSAIGSIAGLFGFEDGGSFKVGGSGGADSQLVAFKASPDETVEIRTPAQQGGSGSSIGQITMHFPNVRDKSTADQAASTMGRELTRILGSAQRYG